MRRRSPCLCLCLFLSLLATWIDVGVAKTVPLIQPGFFFDWNNETAPGPPVPVTTQCERIQIKWGRNGAQGSNPVAPFILQIYTSSDEVPFIVPAGNGPTFNFDVPFAPGTLYQICMFDSKGTPGGCQATYTVIANTTVANPSCQRLTPPSPLAVEATVEMGNGAFSRYGFIPTCTDLSVRPKAGKPPYTMTIAPALHPPYNITSNSMDPITWTVSLSWSFEFYISVVSADGLMWANGPLHAGGFGENDDCLAPNTISRKIARATAAGAGVGSLFAGLIIGALLVLLISWKKGQGFNPLRWQKHRFYPFDEEGKPHRSSMTEVSSPSEASSSPRHHSSGSIPRAFVIHHDAGRAPVTIMTDTPTEFVEMPPQYQYRGRPNGPQVPSRSTSLGATSGGSNSNSTSPVSSIPSDSERSVPYTSDRKDPNGSSSSSPVSVASFSVGTPVASTSSH